MFLLQLLLHRLTLIIPPLPPPKKKNWQNCRFVSLETFVKSAQNQLLSSEIGLAISAKLAFLTIVFWQNLSRIFPPSSAKSAVFSANTSLKIPQNLAFFPQHIRGPVLWMVYIIKLLDLVAFFSLSSNFFPSWTSKLSNLDQLLYLKKVNVWITLEA